MAAVAADAAVFCPPVKNKHRTRKPCDVMDQEHGTLGPATPPPSPAATVPPKTLAATAPAAPTTSHAAASTAGAVPAGTKKAGGGGAGKWIAIAVVALLVLGLVAYLLTRSGAPPPPPPPPPEPVTLTQVLITGTAFTLAEVRVMRGDTNIASQGTAAEISSATGAPGANAGLAIDGDLLTVAGPASQWTLTFATAVQADRVEVYNNQQCCQDALSGARLTVYGPEVAAGAAGAAAGAAADAPIIQRTLTGAMWGSYSLTGGADEIGPLPSETVQSVTIRGR
jgi:hypothetical protein